MLKEASIIRYYVVIEAKIKAIKSGLEYCLSKGLIPITT